MKKEIERQTVMVSNLFCDAVKVAVGNCLNKKKSKLWKKKAMAAEPAISKSEAAAIQKAIGEHAPWTPWGKGGVGVG